MGNLSPSSISGSAGNSLSQWEAQSFNKSDKAVFAIDTEWVSAVAVGGGVLLLCNLQHIEVDKVCFMKRYKPGSQSFNSIPGAKA